MILSDASQLQTQQMMTSQIMSQIEYLTYITYLCLFMLMLMLILLLIF